MRSLLSEFEAFIRNYSITLDMATMRLQEDIAKRKAGRSIQSIKHLVDTAIADLAELRDSECRYISDAYDIDEEESR